MYMNCLCPVSMWIDPGLSSQLTLLLPGLTPQYPWRAHCCWPAPLQHLKPLADASSPPAMPVLLPPQQLSCSTSQAAASPGCSDPVPRAVRPEMRSAMCARHGCAAGPLRGPCSAASAILLVLQCHPLAEAPQKSFSAALLCHR